MNILVNGAAGTMGRVLCQKIQAHPEHTLTAACSRRQGFPDLSSVTAPADVLIDFSHHEATEELTRYAAKRHIPLVTGTTGRTPEEEALLDACAARIPVFSAANFSLGVALLCQLSKAVLNVFPDAEVEIVECHHHQKADVPSGTALLCAKTIQEQRPGSKLVIGRQENGLRTPLEIGIHSLRCGLEPGTHTLLFSCGAETLELKHSAVDRSLFADGALAAAAFLLGKPAGHYGMRDLMEV